MQRRRAITLIELMAVATITAITVGTVAMQVQGAGERALVHGSAAQIEAVYRLAVADAERSGLPRRLELTERVCEVWEPRLTMGEWEWRRCASFSLMRNTRLAEVESNGVTVSRAASDDKWRLVVPAGMFWRKMVFRIAGRRYEVKLTVNSVSSWIESVA